MYVWNYESPLGGMTLGSDGTSLTGLWFDEQERYANPLPVGCEEKMLPVFADTCRWLDICNGNFRVRAEAATGNLWASDPACYLTDEEIGLK